MFTGCFVCLFLSSFFSNNPACSLTGTEQRCGLGLWLSTADDLLDRRDHAGQHDPTNVHQRQRCSGQWESGRGKNTPVVCFLFVFSLCPFITRNSVIMELPAGQSLTSRSAELEEYIKENWQRLKGDERGRWAGGDWGCWGLIPLTLPKPLHSNITKKLRFADVYTQWPTYQTHCQAGFL